MITLNRLEEAHELKDYEEEQNKNNFLNKQIIEQIQQENFDNSVFVRYLAGTTGGSKRLKMIWKPSKLTITKKGPRIEFDHAQV